MEQKQRRVKANPFGEQEEEEGLPSPPEIDDVLKAAEMAQIEQRNAEPETNEKKFTRKEIEDNDGRLVYVYNVQWGEPGFICFCGNENCDIGPFIRRSGKEYVNK